MPGLESKDPVQIAVKQLRCELDWGLVHKHRAAFSKPVKCWRVYHMIKEMSLDTCQVSNIQLVRLICHWAEQALGEQWIVFLW